LLAKDAGPKWLTASDALTLDARPFSGALMERILRGVELVVARTWASTFLQEPVAHKERRS
jgi:hypothetical protein